VGLRRVVVAVHQSSVNRQVANFKHRFLVFHEKIKTSRVFIRDCTVVSPYALLLFGGPITVKHESGQVIYNIKWNNIITVYCYHNAITITMMRCIV
jgi:hypothetical protein